jgi:hypothetical protein
MSSMQRSGRSVYYSSLPARWAARVALWLSIGVLLLGLSGVVGLIVGSAQRFRQATEGLPLLVIASFVCRWAPPSELRGWDAQGVRPEGDASQPSRACDRLRFWQGLPWRMLLAALPCAIVTVLRHVH